MQGTLTKSRTEKSNDRPVVLHLSCELVVDHLPPVHRVSLARELVKNAGMRQVETARILGITQPAVYNYLKSRVKPSRGLSRLVEEIQAVAENLAKEIPRGNKFLLVPPEKVTPRKARLQT